MASITSSFNIFPPSPLPLTSLVDKSFCEIIALAKGVALASTDLVALGVITTVLTLELELYF